MKISIQSFPIISGIWQDSRCFDRAQKKAYRGVNAAIEAIYEIVIGALSPIGLGTMPLKMAHYANVDKSSIFSIFVFLYSLGQNQPAVQIIDTHKKAHVKWASSGLLLYSDVDACHSVMTG